MNLVSRCVYDIMLSKHTHSHTMQIVNYSQQKLCDEIIDISQSTNMLLISNCGIKQLRLFYSTFEYLTFLDISSNSLTSIDILQQLCPYVRALHAQYNKIQEFTIDLKHLQYLNLQNNQLIDIQVPKQVQHLNLQSNQLTRLDLSLNSSLREINVSKNVNLRYLSCSQADILDVSTTALSIQCLSDLVRGRIHFLRMDRMLIIDQDSQSLLNILAKEALEMPRPWADQVLTADGDEIVSRGTQRNIRGVFVLHTFYTSQYFAQITQAFSIPDSEQQATSIRCPINKTALDNWSNGKGSIPFCEIVLDENVKENQQLITEYNQKLQEYKNDLMEAAQRYEAEKKKAKKQSAKGHDVQNINNTQSDKNNQNQQENASIMQLTPEEIEQGYANLSEMINGLFSLNIYGIKSRDHIHVQALQHQIDLLVYYNYNVELFYPLPRIQLSGWEITVCKVAKNLKLSENGTVTRLRLVGCDLGLLNIERLGPYVKQLTIINCGIQHVSQLKILQSYYRLETLNIYDGLQITDFNISLIRILLNDCVSLETINGHPIDISGGSNVLSSTPEDILLHACQQKSIEKLGHWTTLEAKLKLMNNAFQ